ncbi:Hypothetical protein, putative [Bodo saltans]|uniref:Uncharacterized protein n=1 Tax=Bodo saltans TaxID=75058 RepID=A0A0S4JRB9_BODSA|nr:Hypothetical protein, putative [Bodo saltans]|eukprot:CUG94083.1 Hypothetical protein, putative [Bodo saltans]
MKAKVCHPSLFGYQTQNLSSEMLHWDDYCEFVEPQAVKQASMKEQFQLLPFAPVTSQVTKTNGEVESFVFKCVAIVEGQYGASSQNLSQDMIHYDDYMKEIGQVPAGPSLESTFKTFYGHSVETFSSNGERVPLIIMCTLATEQACGAPVQNVSSEMLHWDDYCAAENIPQNSQTMKELFS